MVTWGRRDSNPQTGDPLTRAGHPIDSRARTPFPPLPHAFDGVDPATGLPLLLRLFQFAQPDLSYLLSTDVVPFPSMP